jgi:hypothetical protein
MLWEKDKIRDALERLDRLTKDEGLSAVAQTLGVVDGISNVVMGGEPFSFSFSFSFYISDRCLNTCSYRWKGTNGWYRTEFGFVPLAKPV